MDQAKNNPAITRDLSWADGHLLEDNLRVPFSKDDLKLDGRDYIVGSRCGFPIDEDRSAAKVGCPDASKLRIEYIRKGEYVVERVQRKLTTKILGRDHTFRFRWEDGDQPSTTEVEFDWNDPAHVEEVNKWRKDRYPQITGTITKAPEVEYNKYERDWLREQEAMRTEEIFFQRAGQNQSDKHHTDSVRYARTVGEFADSANFPLHLQKRDLEDLTRRFNETFADKQFYVKKIIRADGTEIERVKDMLVVGSVPRPARSALNIGMQRRRYKPICKQFMIKHNIAKEERDADEFSDESDSDF
jgi:hypothetical protein